ncbi:MAG: adenosylcobinamide-GDP ribazoletransferase, partial [Rickettsiales bacterium]
MLLTAALIGAVACSRAAIGPVMALMGPARADGLSAAAGRPSGGQAAAGVAVGFVIAAFAVGFGEALFLLALAAAIACLIAGLAKRQIGGQTGDILGAAQQIAE